MSRNTHYKDSERTLSAYLAREREREGNEARSINWYARTNQRTVPYPRLAGPKVIFWAIIGFGVAVAMLLKSMGLL